MKSSTIQKEIVKQTDYIVVLGCARAKYEHHHYWDALKGEFTCPKTVGSVRGEPL
jgi:hypothetical protein